MKQETLKDKKFQQKLVDKLNNGELSYQNAPIYTILLDLVQGNSVDEVYRVFCDIIKEQNNNKYSEEEMIDFGFSTYCYISELMGVPFNLISENRLNAEEWFEQFKKK
jgi:hypothetical protein